MALDHYIPASFLGRFSLSSHKKHKANLRKRKLCVYSFKKRKYYETTAEKICAINNFSNPLSDPLCFFEQDLPNALTNLINGTLDAKQWIDTLVPFVCSLLVRGPEFVERFTHRIDNAFGIKQEFKDPVRLFEFQRMLAPILAGKWIVLEANGPGYIIVNDICFMPFIDGRTNLKGISVPISPKHVLIIVPKRNRVIATYVDRKWVPEITRTKMEKRNHFKFNRAMADFARESIIGPTKDSVMLYSSRKDDYSPSRIEETRLDFIDGQLGMIHEYTWHCIAGFFNEDYHKIFDHYLEPDFSKLELGKTPVFILGSNLSTFKHQVYIQGNEMIVDLYDVESLS